MLSCGSEAPSTVLSGLLPFFLESCSPLYKWLLAKFHSKYRNRCPSSMSNGENFVAFETSSHQPHTRGHVAISIADRVLTRVHRVAMY
jgi:hypothetical protein